MLTPRSASAAMTLVRDSSAIQTKKALCDLEEPVVQYGPCHTESKLVRERQHRLVRAQNIPDKVMRSQQLSAPFDDSY
jgi:hypothetical protein